MLPGEVGTELTNFYRVTIHLTLNRLLERQKRNVNGILQLQPFGVPLLEESLGASCVFTDGCGLPRVVAAAGIDLIQTGTALVNTAGLGGWLLLGVVLLCLSLGLNTLVPARNQQTDTVRTNTTRLRSFLHHTSDILHQYPSGRIFVVDTLVACVGDLAGLVDQNPVIRAHTGVDHADVGSD